MTDVLVIGGGVIGLSAAYELAGQGLSVSIVDQSGFGQEASWAGAGMLPPGNFAAATTTEARLRSASFHLWPNWQAQLTEATGIDVGYRVCGALDLALTATNHDFHQLLETYAAEQIAVTALSVAELRQRYAYVNPEISSGCWVPAYAQVRNPWLVRALIAGCQQRNVQLFPECPVLSFEVIANRVHSVMSRTASRMVAERYIIASGAWSQTLLEPLGVQRSVEPVRGQIVLLKEDLPTFHHIIQVGSRYLVPRGDGHILIGSTEEHVGFEKRNTEQGVQDLLEFAYRLVPLLKQARIERTWAGLRPWKPGGLPYIGPVGGIQNLWLAAGHFRAGLQLSPITAVLLRQALLGQPLAIAQEETTQA